MKTGVLVLSKISMIEGYKDQYKFFLDKDKALHFALERASLAGLSLFLLNSVDDFKVRMLFFSEAGVNLLKQ